MSFLSMDRFYVKKSKDTSWIGMFVFDHDDFIKYY